VAIEVKFCTAKRTHMPVGPAEYDVNRCNESPLRGEKPDFWPVSKFNTGIQTPITPYFHTYGRRTLFDLPQTLHGGRARRVHHKRC